MIKKEETDKPPLFCEGILRTFTVVKVEHENEFMTRVWLESSLGDKFMWGMPYDNSWTVGRYVELIANVMDGKTRMDRQRKKQRENNYGKD